MWYQEIGGGVEQKRHGTTTYGIKDMGEKEVKIEEAQNQDQWRRLTRNISPAWAGTEKEEGKRCEYDFDWVGK